MGVHKPHLECMHEFIHHYEEEVHHHPSYELSHVFELAAIVIAVILLIFFVWQYYQGKCGWEVLYVCTVESIVYILDVVDPLSSPYTVFTAEGKPVPLLRYCEWLMTTPVILMALTNIHGEDDDYSDKSMALLLYNIGTIVTGVLSAAAGTVAGTTVFVVLSFVYSFFTFYVMAKVYVEAYYTVPEVCKPYIRFLAIVQYIAWNIYPVLFCIGPEGYGDLPRPVSMICHVITDIFAKNIWSLAHWKVRLEVVRDKEENHRTTALYSPSVRERVRNDAPQIIARSVQSFLHFLTTGHHSQNHEEYRPPPPTNWRWLSEVNPASTVEGGAGNPLAGGGGGGGQFEGMAAAPYSMTSKKDPFGKNNDWAYDDDEIGPAARPPKPAQLSKIVPDDSSDGVSVSALVCDDSSLRGNFFSATLCTIPGVTVRPVFKEEEATRALRQSLSGTYKIVFLSITAADKWPGVTHATKTLHGLPLIIYGAGLKNLSISDSLAIKQALGADELLEAPNIGEAYSMTPLEAIISRFTSSASRKRRTTNPTISM